MSFEIQMRGKKRQGKSFYHRGTEVTEVARRMRRGWDRTGKVGFGRALGVEG